MWLINEGSTTQNKKTFPKLNSELCAINPKQILFRGFGNENNNLKCLKFTIKRDKKVENFNYRSKFCFLEHEIAIDIREEA